MYDELVKRLRNCATQPAPCEKCDMVNDGTCPDTLMMQAVEAIEELSKIREEQKAQIILMAAEDKPRWIPVTERLPEKNGPYLCCWKASADEKRHIARVMVWRADTGWMNAWDEPMSKYVTHWMPLPQPPEEG